MRKGLFLWYNDTTMRNKKRKEPFGRYKRKSSFNKENRITVALDRSLHALLMAYADERKLYLEEALQEIFYKGLMQGEGWTTDSGKKQLEGKNES